MHTYMVVADQNTELLGQPLFLSGALFLRSPYIRRSVPRPSRREENYFVEFSEKMRCAGVGIYQIWTF